MLQRKIDDFVGLSYLEKIKWVSIAPNVFVMGWWVGGNELKNSK